MGFQAVFFDLDGTLLNTLPDLTYITNATLQEAGFPTHTEKEVETYVGNGVELLLKRALPAELREDPGILDRWMPVMRRNYMKYQNLRTES